jgi:hypothetical protein
LLVASIPLGCAHGETNIDTVNAFIRRWQGQEGGQERANYALFLTELCDLIDVDHPEPAGTTHERNDYKTVDLSKIARSVEFFGGRLVIDWQDE